MHLFNIIAMSITRSIGAHNVPLYPQCLCKPSYFSLSSPQRPHHDLIGYLSSLWHHTAHNLVSHMPPITSVTSPPSLSQFSASLSHLQITAAPHSSFCTHNLLPSCRHCDVHSITSPHIHNDLSTCINLHCYPAILLYRSSLHHYSSYTHLIYTQRPPAHLHNVP